MLFILAYVIYVMGHFHKILTTFHLGVNLKCQFIKKNITKNLAMNGTG